VSRFADRPTGCAPSCPDWPALVAARDAALADGAAEAAWVEALDHLDGCAACRRPALATDPTLLFRSLPRVEVNAAEVASMRQAVASMRRAQRVTPEPPRRRFARTAARLAALGRHGRGLAAAALLAATAGGLWLGLPLGERAVEPPAATAGETVPAAPPAEGAPAANEPVFMDLARPHAADVYRVGSGGLQVVMVVDETLDV
jgi:hypothetical protein